MYKSIRKIESLKKNAPSFEIISSIISIKIY